MLHFRRNSLHRHELRIHSAPDREDLAAHGLLDGSGNMVLVWVGRAE